MSADLDKLVDDLSELTVLEAVYLTKKLEEKWGVSATIAAAVVENITDDSTEDAAEAQTEFDVVLVSVGDKKINVIKELRPITGLGLKEAKEMAEGAPSTVKSGVTDAEAETIKQALEAVGATVEIK